MTVLVDSTESPEAMKVDRLDNVFYRIGRKWHKTQSQLENSITRKRHKVCILAAADSQDTIVFSYDDDRYFVSRAPLTIAIFQDAEEYCDTLENAFEAIDYLSKRQRQIRNRNYMTIAVILAASLLIGYLTSK